MKEIKTNITLLSALLIAAVFAASCSDEATPVNTDDKVQFSPTIGGEWNELSRSSSYITSIDRLQFIAGDKIGVFSYYLPGGVNNSTAPDFMYNQEMTFNGTDWTYSPVKYWPNNQDDKLKFWAYYPYNANRMILNINEETGLPEIQFNDMPTYYDLMVADVVIADKTSVNGKVPLVFKHILAKVNLVMRFNPYLDENIPAPTLKLKYVSYTPVPAKGTFLGFDENGNPEWNVDYSEQKTWYDPAIYELSPGEEVFIDQDYTFFMPFYVDHLSYVPLIVPGEGGTTTHSYSDDYGVGNYDEENFAKEKGEGVDIDYFDFNLSKRVGGQGVYAAPGVETTIIVTIGLYGIDNVETSTRPIAEWRETTHTDVYY